MFGFGGLHNADFPAPHGNFKAVYKAFSISMFPGPERSDVEKGGKIIMPPSALDTLTRLNIQYPMLFKLTSEKTKRETHCGVLEFVADEGKIYLPYWMMRNLLIDEGGMLTLSNVSLSVATFAKFQAQTVDFLDITNPKAVLENALRSFACLTKDDIVGITYNDHLYELRVLELKPGNAVSIIECDMNVDFAAPVGYKDPAEEMKKKKQEEEEQEQKMVVDPAEYIDDTFRAFSGSGNRLDGKKKNTESVLAAPQPHEIKRGIPNYDYKPGHLTFLRVNRAQNGAGNGEEDKQDFEAFSGSGQCLRKKNTRK